MKKLRFIISFLIALFSLAYGNDNDLKLVDKVAIVVNGQPILESDIQLAKQWFGIQDKKEAAQRLVDLVLVAQAAEKAGLNVTGEELNRAILQLAKANNLPDEKTFLEKLKEQGIIVSEFKNLIKREILNAKFIQIYLRKNLFKGIAEGKPEKVRTIRIIYLKKDRPDFVEKFKAVKRNLGKEPFDKLAKEYSDDPLTADKGGLLGEVKRGDLLPSLDRAIWSHKVGDTFEVKTDNGVYFVKIEKEDEKVSIIPVSGEEIKGKLKKEYQLFMKKIKENAVVEYLDKDLK